MAFRRPSLRAEQPGQCAGPAASQQRAVKAEDAVKLVGTACAGSALAPAMLALITNRTARRTPSTPYRDPPDDFLRDGEGLTDGQNAGK
jgi:hypothetical protein